MIQARFLFLREARAFVKTGSRLTSKREGCSTDCDEQATTLRDCGQALRCAVQVPFAKLGVYSTALEERDFCFAHENDNKNLENNAVATGNRHLAQYQLGMCMHIMLYPDSCHSDSGRDNLCDSVCGHTLSCGCMQRRGTRRFSSALHLLMAG